MNGALVAAVVLAHNDQMHIVRQLGKGTDHVDLVLAFLDGADTDDVFLGQVVGFAHVSTVTVADRLPEHGVAGLVDDLDFFLRHLEILYQVALGLLADGHHDIGNAAGVALLHAVHHAVEGLVKAGVAPHDEVVHGNHALDGVGNAMGQLVAEAMENLHFVAFEVHRHSETPPYVGEIAIYMGGFAG